MSQISNAIESILFRARFLLAPLYLGLVGALILLTYRFLIEFYHIAVHIGEATPQSFTLELLALLDLKMIFEEFQQPLETPCTTAAKNILIFIAINKKIKEFYDEVKKYKIEDIICIDETSISGLQKRHQCNNNSNLTWKCFPFLLCFVHNSSETKIFH